MLQHNIEVVTRHIRQKLEARHEEDIERKVLHFLPSTNGKTYFYIVLQHFNIGKY